MDTWLKDVLTPIVALAVGIMTMNAATWNRANRMRNNAEVLKLLNALRGESESATGQSDVSARSQAQDVQGTAPVAQPPVQDGAAKVMDELINALQKDAEATKRAVSRKGDFWIAVVGTGIISAALIVSIVWGATTSNPQMFKSALIAIVVLCIPGGFTIISTWEKWHYGDKKPEKEKKKKRRARWKRK